MVLCNLTSNYTYYVRERDDTNTVPQGERRCVYVLYSEWLLFFLSSSLHGWQYIYQGKSEWRVFWSGMVLSSVVVACCFVFKQVRIM